MKQTSANLQIYYDKSHLKSDRHCHKWDSVMKSANTADCHPCSHAPDMPTTSFLVRENYVSNYSSHHHKELQQLLSPSKPRPEQPATTCSTMPNTPQMLPWKDTRCSSCWPALATPKTTSSRKTEEPKLCPQAGPFVSWCSSIRAVCTVTLCGWYLLPPPHQYTFLKWYTGPPVAWQVSPPTSHQCCSSISIYFYLHPVLALLPS